VRQANRPPTKTIENNDQIKIRREKVGLHILSRCLFESILFIGNHHVAAEKEQNKPRGKKGNHAAAGAASTFNRNKRDCCYVCKERLLLEEREFYPCSCKYTVSCQEVFD